MTVASIEVWQADGSARIDFGDSETDMSPYVTKFGIRDTLSEFGRQETTATLEMGVGCPPSTETPAVLTHRRIIRVNYDDTSAEDFRIVRFNRAISADGSTSLVLEPIWLDLASTVARQNITLTGRTQTDLEWYLVGVTATKALQEIMQRGQPTGWTHGTVASKFATTKVFLHCVGNNHLQLIRNLCRDIATRTGERCEWDYRRSGSMYFVDLVDQLGGTITHPIEGHIEGEASKWNRRRSLMAVDATRYFSRVVPLGGADGETGTIADAVWVVNRVVVPSGSETRYAIEFTDDLIFTDGSPSATGLKLVRQGSTSGEITVAGTKSPNIVYSATDPGAIAGTKWKFAVGTSDLYYLNDAAAEAKAGVKQRLLRRSDISPYANLIVESGLDPTFSTWSSGRPTGWVAKPGTTPTFTRTTDARYVKTGTSSMRVTGGAGDAVQVHGDTGGGIPSSYVLDLSGEGYTSLWINMRVLAGSFRFDLVNDDPSNPVSYPGADLQAIGVADKTFRGLSIGGLAPEWMAGEGISHYYVPRFTCLEADTDFVVDSITVTRSATPVDYREDMGPQALWKAGAVLLAREGGLLPNRFEATWIDLSKIPIGEFTAGTPKIGATVSFKDAGESVSSRLVELQRNLAGDVHLSSGKLGSRAPDVTGFLTETGRRISGVRIGVEPTPPPPGQVSVDDLNANPKILVTFDKDLVQQVQIDVPTGPNAALGTVNPTGGVLRPAQAGDSEADLFQSTAVGNSSVVYEVGVTSLTNPSGMKEAALGVGAKRGRYNVWVFKTANSPDTATLVGTVVLRGATVSHPEILYDSVRYRTATQNRFVDVFGLRVTGGATPVWRVNDGTWTAFVVQSGLHNNDVTMSRPTISKNTAGNWDFTFSTSLFPHAQAALNFAARTGAGDDDDPYVYNEAISVPLLSETELKQQNVLVTQEPANAGGRPEGTLFCLPVSTTPT